MKFRERVSCYSKSFIEQSLNVIRAIVLALYIPVRLRILPHIIKISLSLFFHFYHRLFVRLVLYNVLGDLHAVIVVRRVIFLLNVHAAKGSVTSCLFTNDRDLLVTTRESYILDRIVECVRFALQVEVAIATLCNQTLVPFVIAIEGYHATRASYFA